MKITEEEFASWREDPVTQWVLAACVKAAEQHRAAWEAVSWVGGEADPLTLNTLRTRADAYRALNEAGWADWAKAHGEDE